MSMKRFGAQLRKLLAGLDENAKVTPAELLAKASGFSGSAGDDVVIADALKKPRFNNKVVRAVRRSDSGRVVLYARKGDPMVMTIERYNALAKTVKAAQEGVRKYWASRKPASA